MNGRDISKLAISLILAGVVVGGCSSAPPRTVGAADASAQMPVHGEVYLLRGLFDIFSLGMDTMGEMLRQRGIDATVHSGPSWPYLGEQINDHREHGQSQGPLVISGHSYGADDAIRLARTLNEKGVMVDALVLVDPTTPPKVPANVEICINFFRSNPSTDWMPWLRGVPVERESSSTVIINRDLRFSPNDNSLVDEVNHFNIEEHPRIQKMVVEEIEKLLQRRAVAGEGLPLSSPPDDIATRHDD